MSVQIALGAPGHPGRVPEARAGRGQSLAAGGERAGRLGDEHVGEHVRQMRDERPASRSWVSASIAVGCAPRAPSSRCRRS